MFILYDLFNIIHAFHSCYVLKQFRLLFIVSLKSHDESPVYLMHIPVEQFDHRYCTFSVITLNFGMAPWWGGGMEGGGGEGLSQFLNIIFIFSKP